VPSAWAAAGDLYEADLTSGIVYKFDQVGEKTIFASGLSNASAIGFDSDGNVYVAAASQIIKFTPSGQKSTFASSVGAYAIRFNSAGTMFVADAFSNSILTFSPSGTKSTFASGLNTPFDIAFDKTGNLYEADGGTGAVLKFSPTGVKSGFVHGMNAPTGLAFDFSGNLYVSDGNANAIYVFTPSGARTTFRTGTSVGSIAFDSHGTLFGSSYGLKSIIEYPVSGGAKIFANGLGQPQGIGFEPARGYPLNIATRADVETGNNVVIAGFIIKGSNGKKVLLRGTGPSLAGVPSPLQDPVLELRGSNQQLINSNDNWRDTQEAAITETNLQPHDDRESGLLITLGAGSYTAILTGKNATHGVGVAELYDLDSGNTNARLANISTRALVGTTYNVTIGGFIIGGNGGQVLVRGLGPSLSAFGITNPLPDPVVELYNFNGDILASNDNWKSSEQAAIQNTGIAPGNDLEAALIATLPQGSYTAILQGKAGATGVGIVEIYSLD
jgi:sugar lactone lactonase YvrE